MTASRVHISKEKKRTRSFVVLDANRGSVLVTLWNRWCRFLFPFTPDGEPSRQRFQDVRAKNGWTKSSSKCTNVKQWSVTSFLQETCKKESISFSTRDSRKRSPREYDSILLQLNDLRCTDRCLCSQWRLFW